jgi:2-methylcitrate dehydratase PrpD
MLKLRCEGASPENLAAIRVNVHPTIVRMCGATDVSTLLDAQMSLPYAISVALVHGGAGLPMFSEAVRRDHAVLEQARRVEVVESVEPMSNVAAELVLDFRDGGQRRLRIDVPLGSATNPLPDDGVIAKYRSLAAPNIGPEAASRLEDAVLSLGKGVRPDEILQPLHPPLQ